MSVSVIESAVPVAFECVVCYEDGSATGQLTLACKHMVCLGCYTTMRGGSNNATPPCPCCRRAIRTTTGFTDQQIEQFNRFVYRIKSYARQVRDLELAFGFFKESQGMQDYVLPTDPPLLPVELELEPRATIAAFVVPVPAPGTGPVLQHPGNGITGTTTFTAAPPREANVIAHTPQPFTQQQRYDRAIENGNLGMHSFHACRMCRGMFQTHDLMRRPIRGRTRRVMCCQTCATNANRL